MDFRLCRVCIFMSTVIQLATSMVASEVLHFPNGDMHEYCNMETFQARCTHGDVIAMRTALFGRMRVGRCISSDAVQLQQLHPDSLGCSSDVLSYFDRTCSGKSSCDVIVPNPDLYSYRPCSAQLSMYLEASYICVSVVDEDRSCSIAATVGGPLFVSRSTRGRPHVADRTIRCGSRMNPWLVDAQTGQQINIMMFDFGSSSDQQHRTGISNDQVASGVGELIKTSGDMCSVKYGYIMDKASSRSRNSSICSSDANLQRERLLYQSKGSSLEIVLFSTDTDVNNSNKHNFLLGFEAVGCSNLVPPVDAWLRRNDNETTVGCYTTRQRWHLRCEDGQWKGTIGQCVDLESHSKELMSGFVKAEDLNSENKPFVNLLTTLAVSFIGVAVCLIIIFIGIGCSQRYKRDTLKAGQYPSIPRNQQHVSKMVNLGPHTNENIGFTSTDARHQYFILDKELAANQIDVNTSA